MKRGNPAWSSESKEVKAQHLSQPNQQRNVLLVWIGLKMEAEKIIFEDKNIHLSVSTYVLFLCMYE